MVNFNEVLILDGATGTQLHKRGLPPGVCPEEWILENPNALVEVQSAYKNAGSDAVYAPTFGANRKKLPPYMDVYETNLRLLKLCRQAVGEDVLIGGDLSPTGELLYPMGSMTEDELISVYEEQIRAFYDFSVDFIVIETMMDIREVKCALLAVKNIYKEQKCPVFVTVTLEESGRMLTGTDPLTAMLIAEHYGADAFGLNCSSGPDKMLPVIDALLPYASVGLIAKPNAGLPRQENGETVFSMAPSDFKKYARRLVERGVNLIGGCCGTSPEYIREIASLKIPVMPVKPKNFPFVSSQRTTVFTDDNTRYFDAVLTDDTDTSDFPYELSDADADVIRLSVNCSEETLKDFFENLLLCITPPILYKTDSPKMQDVITRYDTGASRIV